MIAGSVKRWAEWIFTALAVLALVFPAVMKLAGERQMLEAWGHLAWPASALRPIAVLDLACVALYVFPRTAVLGALLLTGYLGGAIASHMRVGDSIAFPVIVGALLWFGLYLRDSRMRALLSPLQIRTLQ